MAVTGDLGRVQGASLFHTMASSGTSIAVSSLQPQLTAFVGDAVQFSNGDVRQITKVSGNTVTLGDVLFSFKGDPGIGNATLSNVDGDGTENGFTQAAVKGVAQAKNYYNLGAFDTYVSNGDGTGTVTRKTGYGSLYESEQRQTENGFTLFVFEKEDISGNRIVINKNIPYEASLTFTKEHYYYETINAHPYFVFIVKSDNVKFFFQYEISEAFHYTEQVIENQPIRPANQEEELYWHDEWKKGLNLFSVDLQKTFKTTENSSHTLTVNVSSNSQPWINDFATYTGSGEGKGDTGIGIWKINVPEDFNLYWRIGYNGNVTDDKQSFNMFLKKGNYVLLIDIQTNEPNNIVINSYMLVRGTTSYPYEPYNGGIVRQKDLSGIQLFPTDINPAQTIGGDWEDKGTVTTSDNTVFHAYRRL